jgi:hypothetical protein
MKEQKRAIRVLIVEDSPTQTREGIRAYQKQTPHLIMCDLIMGEKEDLETINPNSADFVS